MAEAIQAERTKVASITALEGELSALQTKIDSLANQLNGFIEKRLALASDVMNVNEQPIQKGDDQLKIEIRPYVKSVHVRDLLHDCVKYVSNPQIRTFAQDFEPKDENFKTYSTAVATVVQQSIEEVLEFEGEHKLAGLLQELLGNSIYLNYNLMLGEDSFSIMSPGKRALALLRVIIELDASEHPIVLDQPEDDLDNRSIYEGLATYLKSKEQVRQIIVVTHSPNVVVGGDSEYVVVANQTGQEASRDNEHYRFEYVYGGLERSFFDDGGKWVLYKQGIREHVCEILDGGKDAFQRREQLYSTVKERS
jgi:predicted ATP-dependent endonuclease of OLD family